MNETLRIILEIITPVLSFVGGLVTKTFVDKRKNIKKNSKSTTINVNGNGNFAVGGNYNEGKKHD